MRLIIDDSVNVNKCLIVETDSNSGESVQISMLKGNFISLKKKKLIQLRDVLNVFIDNL